MIEQKSQTEMTSADKSQIGFDFQYLYFIVRLLQLLPNEEVGYEALDDVHVVTSSNKDTLYIQVKHTIETTPSALPVNLTRLSEDLWKPISNWTKVITDPTKNRVNSSAQKQFITQSRFVLYVNRNIQSNEVIGKIQQLKDGEITGTEIKNYFTALKNETTDKTIATFIDKVSSLSTSILSLFLKRTDFISSLDSMFDQIRDGIRSKMTADVYVDDVFGALYLQLKEDFFNKVKSGKHQVISFTEWTTRYRAVFDTYRTTLLPFRQYSPLLPAHLEEQVFVKELIEIGAIDMSNNGLAEIAELTEFYLKVELQLNDWHNDGRISLSTIKDFHKDAAVIWKRIHKACHRATKSNPSLNFENALVCFDEVMREKLKLLSNEIGVALSNGEFIKLANEKKIGWKYEWTNWSRSNGD